MVRDVVRKIGYQAPVSPDEVADAVHSALQQAPGPERDVLLSGLLIGLVAVGYGGPHLAAAIRAATAEDGLDDAAQGRIRMPMPVLAVAGSGKKARRTRNISTLAALVAATAGISVVKNVSSGVSSALGSADLMAHFGLVPTALTAQRAADVLHECGFVATAIESTASRLDRVYGGRFTVPNAMSFGLAAMLTPIAFDSLVFGLAHPAIDLACDVFRLLNVTQATVISTRVSQTEYIDEFLATGELIVATGTTPQADTWTPRAVDPHRAAHEFWTHISPSVDPASDAQASLDVLSGKGTYAYVTGVAATAAPMLVQGRRAESLDAGYDIATDILACGAARTTLERFIALAG